MDVYGISTIVTQVFSRYPMVPPLRQQLVPGFCVTPLIEVTEPWH